MRTEFLSEISEISEISQIAALNESMLDISIKAQDKVLTSKAKREQFLTSEVTVLHKTDGVKLTVLKIQNEGKLTDYIFQYKGNILYPGEYDYETNFQIKRNSTGQSQFGLVFDHFEKKVNKNSIPVGTELFIEFLMNKPTLSSNYNTKHKMVLIGYSKSSYEQKFGKLKTNPSGFTTTKRQTYARELGIDVPMKLFQGVLGTSREFESGIIHPDLRKEFNSRKLSMNFDNDELLIQDIQDIFLQIDSKYGGKEEGVVINYGTEILKFQQQYQLNQEARRQIKQKFQEKTPELESLYWDQVKRVQAEMALSISRRRGNLEQKLKELSDMLKAYKPEFHHCKKCSTNIKDDIQLNQKTLIIKNLRGNNGQLILGKFRILTKNGHVKLINKALREYDEVTVCLVTGKENKETRDLRLKMLKDTFSNNPKLHIIEARTGNLLTIINKSPININQVIQGSDRVDTYQKQLQRTLGINIQELQRDKDQISQTEVISKIDNEEFFKKNTPPEVHKYYNEVIKAYKD